MMAIILEEIKSCGCSAKSSGADADVEKKMETSNSQTACSCDTTFEQLQSCACGAKTPSSSCDSTLKTTDKASTPSSSCACASQKIPSVPTKPLTTIQYAIYLLVAFVVWFGLYNMTVPVSQWLTFDVFGLTVDSPLAEAVEFFIYDTTKILLLLIFMVYVIAWLRAALNIERVRDYLAGKGRALGYLTGAGFGAVTPFCSCSSIPLFLGFTTARIPLGITMTFLITSPLINEVAVVLLWGLLGWKFTVTYVTVGLLAGIIGGILMDIFKAERWLQPFLLKAMAEQAQQKSFMSLGRKTMSAHDRHLFAKTETRDIVGRVWKWVIIGVGIGAALHGYVPEQWFAEHLGAGQWWSVPFSVLLGIPLYTNATGIIPIMESLLLKGLPVGTTLAFCMSSVAVSLPELLMLKQVMRKELLMGFVVLLLVLFTVAGWILNGFPNAIG